MKAVISFLLSLLFINISFGQYYYNDIITTQQTNRQYLLLKNNHIRQVSASSYEANGELTDH
ncbi:MAG TPA: hypothetical protein VH396_12765, partial [Chitinophagaceae bacterium]